MVSRLSRLISRPIMIAIMLSGLWQISTGGQIYLKAWLATQLLEQAWASTLQGGKGVRPWPWADTWPVAELSVPRLGIRKIILNGDSGRVLAFAPGYAQASAVPGRLGTTVISGHRDTTFSFLESLEDGDIIKLKTSAGNFVYQVNEQAIVDQRYFRINTDVDMLDSGANLMLVTCYPFDALKPGGNKRYLVLATGKFAVPG